jgi:N-acetyl sugar amidotransferase
MKRRNFLNELCDRYRRYDGQYDCIIPVSGGKDSYYQVFLMTRVYHMTPLLVCVTDPFEHTVVGTQNHQNIGEAFRCDMVTLALNPEFIAKTSVATFKALGSTNWVVDKAIYAWPLQVAIEKGIKLIIYGENVAWEYGGVNAEDTYDANTQILNDVVKRDGESVIEECDPTGKHSNALHYPTADALKAAGIQAIYISYFYPWNDIENVTIAEEWGFKRLGPMWVRRGFLDNYAQIDSVGYLFNYYLKFQKYGIGRVVDIGSRWVRYGKITKEELAALIRQKEGQLDDQILEDFLRITGLSHKECQTILKKWWNRDIFTLDANDNWQWREPI